MSTPRTQLAAAGLPQHLVASPWVTFARVDYFDCLSLETPALSDDGDGDASSTDDDDEGEEGDVRPYKAFPITPPALVVAPVDVPQQAFKLALPAFPPAGGRRSSSFFALLASASRAVAPLTPPSSPPVGRLYAPPHFAHPPPQPPRTKADVHTDTPRPVSPHRDRSWDGFFAPRSTANVELELVREQGSAVAVKPADGGWEIESVQLWLRH